MLLVDTDVMIDALRGYAPALAWLESLGDDTIGVPGLVAMELLQGCRNRTEQRRLERFLRPYALYWPSIDDCLRAYTDFASFHLSHGLGLLDALIGETVIGLAAPLATFNAAHYGPLTALTTVQPYERV